jgi:hypothetical protein
MNTDLKKYVKDKLHSGVSEEIIKHNLEKAGWDGEEIEHALNDGYKSKRNKTLIGIFSSFTAIILIIMTVSIITFYQGTLDPVNKEEIVTEPNEPTPQNFSLNCSDEEFQNKHECYMEKIENNYDCSEIEDLIEQNFCFRALEEYLLQ